MGILPPGQHCIQEVHTQMGPISYDQCRAKEYYPAKEKRDELIEFGYGPQSKISHDDARYQLDEKEEKTYQSHGS